MNLEQIIFIIIVYVIPGIVSYIGLRHTYRSDEEIKPVLGDLAVILLPGVNLMGAIAFGMDLLTHYLDNMDEQEPKERKTNPTVQKLLNRFFGIK